MYLRIRQTSKPWHYSSECELDGGAGYLLQAPNYGKVCDIGVVRRVILLGGQIRAGIVHRYMLAIYPHRAFRHVVNDSLKRYIGLPAILPVVLSQLLYCKDLHADLHSKF